MENPSQECFPQELRSISTTQVSLLMTSEDPLIWTLVGDTFDAGKRMGVHPARLGLGKRRRQLIHPAVHSHPACCLLPLAIELYKFFYGRKLGGVVNFFSLLFLTL